MMDVEVDATSRARDLIAQTLTAVQRRPTPERVKAAQKLREDFLQVWGALSAGKLDPARAEPRMRKLGERAEGLLAEVGA